jgi:hypothetical protein
MVAAAVAVGRQDTHLAPPLEEARMQTARLAERIPFTAPVELIAPGSAAPWSVAAQDVSETGIFVRTTEAFSTGDLLSLRFEVDGAAIHVRAAEVMWTRRVDALQRDERPPGLGLRFVSIEPSSRAAIARMVHRTLTQRRPVATTSTEARAPLATGSGWTMGTQLSTLPAPQLTLPPLSPSIIEQSGARDVEDTQDLLPPESLRRKSTDDVVATSTPFRALEVSLPPDEPNLSTESRVFEGVPPTPRPVSLAPVLDVTRHPISPRAVTLGPQPAARPIDLRDRTITPRLFTMPPGLVRAGLTTPSSAPLTTALTTLSSITSLPPASPEVSALMQSSSGSPDTASAISVSSCASTPSSSSSSPPSSMSSSAAPATDDTAASPDLFAGWSFRRALADPPTTSSPGEHAHQGAMPTQAAAAHHGPATDADGVTLPGGPALSSISVAVVESSEAYTLGGDVRALPADAGPHVLGAGVDAAHQPGSFEGEREGSSRRAQPVRAHRRRSSWLQALGVVALGCTAGAAVVLGGSWPASPPASRVATSSTATVAMAQETEAASAPKVSETPAAPAATTATTTAATTTAATTTAATTTAATTTPSPPAPAPRPVEVAEAELRGGTGTVAPAGAANVAVSALPLGPASTTSGIRAEAPTTAPLPSRHAEPATAAALAALGGRHVVELPRAGVVRKAFALAGPARVVVDLEDAALPSTAIQVGKGGVEAVRFGQPEPNTQRVVLVLDGAQKPDAVEARIQDERLIVSWQR